MAVVAQSVITPMIATAQQLSYVGAETILIFTEIVIKQRNSVNALLEHMDIRVIVLSG